MALNEADMKVGDVVRLNSGGPNMVIEGLFNLYAGQTANCVWFTQDGMCQRGEFLRCILVAASFVDAL